MPLQARPERGALGPSGAPEARGARRGWPRSTGRAIRTSTPTSCGARSPSDWTGRWRASWSATARTRCSASRSRRWCGPAPRCSASCPRSALYEMFVRRAGGAPALPAAARRTCGCQIDELASRDRARRRVARCSCARPTTRPARRRRWRRSSGCSTRSTRRSSSTTPTASSAASTTGRCSTVTRTCSSSAPSPRRGRSAACGSAIWSRTRTWWPS